MGGQVRASLREAPPGDAEGEALDVLLQKRRDKRAAMTLLRRLLKKQRDVPTAIVTDRLPSYRAALQEIELQTRQERGGRLNNRAENSHRPTRRRERSWIGRKHPGTTQGFLASHAAVYNTFNLQRYLICRRTLRDFRQDAFDQWRTATEAA